MTDVSDLGADDEVEDFSRFISGDERRMLKAAKKHLPLLVYWELESLLQRLCKELDASEKKVSLIFEDTCSIVVMANKLFNKVDTF